MHKKGYYILYLFIKYSYLNLFVITTKLYAIFFKNIKRQTLIRLLHFKNLSPASSKFLWVDKNLWYFFLIVWKYLVFCYFDNRLGLFWLFFEILCVKNKLIIHYRFLENLYRFKLYSHSSINNTGKQNLKLLSNC